MGRGVCMGGDVIYSVVSSTRESTAFISNRKLLVVSEQQASAWDCPLAVFLSQRHYYQSSIEDNVRKSWKSRH